MQLIIRLCLSIFISFFSYSSLVMAAKDRIPFLRGSDVDGIELRGLLDETLSEEEDELDINLPAIPEDDELLVDLCPPEDEPSQTHYGATNQDYYTTVSPGLYRLEFRTSSGRRQQTLITLVDEAAGVRECPDHPNDACGCLQGQSPTSAITSQPSSNTQHTSSASQGNNNSAERLQSIRIRRDDIPYLRGLARLLDPNINRLLPRTVQDAWSHSDRGSAIVCAFLCCECLSVVVPGGLVSCIGIKVASILIESWCGTTTLIGGLVGCHHCYNEPRSWIATIRFNRTVPKSAKDTTIGRLNTILHNLAKKTRNPQLTSMRTIEEECVKNDETSEQTGQQIELQVEVQIPHRVVGPQRVMEYLGLQDDSEKNVTVELARKR